MKYVNEYRKEEFIKKASRRIFEIMPKNSISIMEVCGTHTPSFHRFGLRDLIPDSLDLIAGPGCPVCVSEQDYIDKAIQLSKDNNTIILTFGDMLRVPGSYTSLAEQRAEGADVRVVYSPWDSLRVAQSNPSKRIIFLAVGFETTAGALALTLQTAKKEKIKNLFFLSSLKLIPPAMKALISDGQLKIDGFLCPGHVSTIIGSQAYEFIPEQYEIACCVAGFEPLDILEGIYFLIRQILQDSPRVDNQYVRAVRKAGNPKARAEIFKVFKIGSAVWRGLGEIPQSGLELKDGFSSFDIEKTVSFSNFNQKWNSAAAAAGKASDSRIRKLKVKQKQCRCAEVLRGIIRPPECSLFKKSCRPDNPYGPCMVSNEGACNVFYRYK